MEELRCIKEKMSIRPEKLFVYLASIFVGISLFLLPVTEAPDELMHAKNAWEILYQTDIEMFQDGAGEFKIDGPAHIDGKRYVEYFSQKRDFSKEKTHWGFSVKKIAYLPQLVGMLIGRVIYPSAGVILTCGRIVNAAVYVLFFYCFIKKIAYGKWLLLFVSLLPMMVHQAGSLSYDVLSFVSVAGFFTFFVNLIVKKKLTNADSVHLLLLLVLLYAVKPNNLLLVFLLAFVHFRFEGFLECLNPSLHFFQRHRSKFVVAGLILLAIGGAVFLHYHGGNLHFIKMMLYTTFVPSKNAHLNSIETIGIFGYFGWLSIQMPLWLIFVDIVVLSILFLSEGQFSVPKMTGRASLLVFPLQVVVIETIMYFLWTLKALKLYHSEVSLGSQGRYYTPFLLYFFPYIASLREKCSLQANQRSLSHLVAGILLFNFLVYCGLLVGFFWI